MALQPLQGLGIHILGISKSQSFRQSSICRNLVDQLLAGNRELYLPTHSIHKRHTSMIPTEFNPAVPASDRPHPQALDRVFDRENKGLNIQKKVSLNEGLIILKTAIHRLYFLCHISSQAMRCFTAQYAQLRKLDASPSSSKWKFNSIFTFRTRHVI